MSEQHVELILQWEADANTDRVRDWLRQRGIGFMPMQSGLLIFGNKGTFDQHLSVSLDNITPPAQIPVPPELQNDVKSIMLPSPRRPYA
jgi:hypothetical protein